MNPPLFAYHSGAHALIVSLPGQQPFGISVADLRAVGWKIDDIEMARGLPRAGGSLVRPGGGLDAKAREAARKIIG